MKKQFSKYPAKKILALESAARLGMYKNIIKYISFLINSAPNIPSEHLKFNIGVFSDKNTPFDLPQICAILSSPALLLKSLQNCSNPVAYLKTKDSFGHSILHLFLMNCSILDIIAFDQSEHLTNKETKQNIFDLFKFLHTHDPQIFNSKDRNENTPISYVIENIPNKTFLFILLLSFGAQPPENYLNISPSELLQEKINSIDTNSIDIWSPVCTESTQSTTHYLLQNWLHDKDSFTKEHLEILLQLPLQIQEKFAMPPNTDLKIWHEQISKHQLLNVWLSNYLLTKEIQSNNIPANSNKKSFL